MSTITTNNYVIGGADIYFSATVGLHDVMATAFKTNSHSLGNITTSGMTPEVTFVDHWVARKGKRVKDKTVANTSAIVINFTFDELNQKNLARFFMGDQTASLISVLEDTLAEGSAQLVVETDIGNDFTYMIPKCTLRSDGGLEFGTGEDWTSGPMVLEVLELLEDDSENESGTRNASIWTEYTNAPFGKIDTQLIS